MRRIPLLVTLLDCSIAAAQPGEDGAISVMFLGDDGHHEPGDRAHRILPDCLAVFPRRATIDSCTFTVHYIAMQGTLAFDGSG